MQHKDGTPLTENQLYDLSVICTDEDNFLYYGFAPCAINIPRYKGMDMKGGSVVRLADDMLTVEEGPAVVLPSMSYGKGTSFEGNEYFEGPSIRMVHSASGYSPTKASCKWYLVYCSVHSHQLCYATSNTPMSGFVYGGVIVSNGDVGYGGRKEEDCLMSIGNIHGIHGIHGGLVEVRGQ